MIVGDPDVLRVIGIYVNVIYFKISEPPCILRPDQPAFAAVFGGKEAVAVPAPGIQVGAVIRIDGNAVDLAAVEAEVMPQGVSPVRLNRSGGTQQQDKDKYKFYNFHTQLPAQRALCLKVLL